MTSSGATTPYFDESTNQGLPVSSARARRPRNSADVNRLAAGCRPSRFPFTQPTRTKSGSGSTTDVCATGNSSGTGRLSVSRNRLNRTNPLRASSIACQPARPALRYSTKPARPQSVVGLASIFNTDVNSNRFPAEARRHQGLKVGIRVSPPTVTRDQPSPIRLQRQGKIISGNGSRVRVIRPPSPPLGWIAEHSQ